MQEGNGVLRLSELSAIVAGVFSMHFSGERYWVSAEIIGLKVSRGHCYLQLAEKDNHGSTPKAEFRGIIWAYQYERISQRFFRSTGSPLREQIQVLIQVEVQYHERYGLSLLVQDIDPAFTLGQLEMERRQTIEKLRKAGLYERNKQVPLPASMQRIAVISAEDSKGYEDFINRLQTNTGGYTYQVSLYTSLLQGDLAAGDIVAKLQRIKADTLTRNFDAVVMVRGGGGASSLECFNNYFLAEAIATFPLPVITGIGHHTNKSVADEVAHTDRMTPTDVANFLIEHQTEFENEVLSLWEQIRELTVETLALQQEFIQTAITTLQREVRQAISDERRHADQQSFTLRHMLQRVWLYEKNRLEQCRQQLRKETRQQIHLGHSEHDQFSERLRRTVPALLVRREEELRLSEKQLRILDPAEVLKRGYSYTLHRGTIVTDAARLQPGDTIHTVFHTGSANATINETHHG